MSKKELAWYGAALVVLLAFAWMVRWQPVSTGEGPYIYLLDRWTGHLYFVRVDDKVLVTEQK